MLPKLEKFSSETKACVESQFATLNALGGKAVESGQKAITLNIATAKAFAEESTSGARQLISAKSPQEFFAIAGAQAKLRTDKAVSYGRNVAEIMSSINADLTKVAQTQIAESKDKVAALVDDVIKNAPAGSESAVALLKSIVSNANASYNQLSKSTKQVVETVEASIAEATDQLSQAVKETA
jgi:phasin family protein